MLPHFRPSAARRKEHRASVRGLRNRLRPAYDGAGGKRGVVTQESRSSQGHGRSGAGRMALRVPGRTQGGGDRRCTVEIQSLEPWRRLPRSRSCRPRTLRNTHWTVPRAGRYFTDKSGRRVLSGCSSRLLAEMIDSGKCGETLEFSRRQISLRLLARLRDAGSSR